MVLGLDLASLLGFPDMEDDARSLPHAELTRRLEYLEGFMDVSSPYHRVHAERTFLQERSSSQEVLERYEKILIRKKATCIFSRGHVTYLTVAGILDNADAYRASGELTD